MESGDLDGAERKLEAALALDSENAVALHDLGFIAFRRGNIVRAQPLLERAAELDPTAVPPHRNLGALYLSLGRFADAAAQLELAVKLDPKGTENRLYYARALQAAGDLRGALGQYRLCIKQDPELLLADYGVADMLARLGHRVEAQNVLRSLLAKNPPDELAEHAAELLRRLGSGR
jgi:tetratricopeptide (TPR) repeat protein